VPSHGVGLLRIGNPGNRGGPGRPPDAQRQMWRDILADPDHDAMLLKILRGESFVLKGNLCLVDGDTYLRARSWVEERAYGKPPQTEDTPGERGKTLTIRLIKVVQERSA
jgi:hypothetical protein